MKDIDEKKTVNIKNENNENDYNMFKTFVTPNHYVGRNIDSETLKQRKMRSQINHLFLTI